MKLSSPVPVILCIDVEPDERQVDLQSERRWPGFEATVAFFTEVRPRIEQTTGSRAKFNWFLRMDPQVERVYGSASWAVQHYDALLDQLERAGDEIGLHTHAWRWDEPTAQWIADHGNQEWVEHCVRMSFTAYKDSFGRHCRSFRFGDHWMNNKTMHQLESLGVKFDLTIEPGKKPLETLNSDEPHTGSLPDYQAAPRRAYKPSRKDFIKVRGLRSRKLWAIPLTTGCGQIHTRESLTWLDRLVSNNRCTDDMHTLDFGMRPQDFNHILKQSICNGCTYVAPVMRSSTCADVDQLANLKENINTLALHAQAQPIKFVTPPEAIELMATHKRPTTRRH